MLTLLGIALTDNQVPFNFEITYILKGTFILYKSFNAIRMKHTITYIGS
jgi:hypothetical protein